MARIIIKIEIEPDPDGKHCGDCHLVERGGWCSAFDRRLDGILGRWDCCPECLAARVPAEIKRLQAENAAIDEVLGAAVEEYGREAAEVVLTRTADGSVQIETRCKPEADEFATGETVSNAASNMVGRWCE